MSTNRNSLPLPNNVFATYYTPLPEATSTKQENMQDLGPLAMSLNGTGTITHRLSASRLGPKAISEEIHTQHVFSSNDQYSPAYKETARNEIVNPFVNSKVEFTNGIHLTSREERESKQTVRCGPSATDEGTCGISPWNSASCHNETAKQSMRLNRLNKRSLLERIGVVLPFKKGAKIPTETDNLELLLGVHNQVNISAGNKLDCMQEKPNKRMRLDSRFRTTYETTIRASAMKSQPGSPSPTGVSKKQAHIHSTVGCSNIAKKKREGLEREQLNRFQNETFIQLRSGSSLNHQVVKEDLPYSIKSSLNHQVAKEDLPYSIKSSLNHQVVKEDFPYSIKSSLNHQVVKEDLPYSIKSSLNHQVAKEDLPYSIKSSLNHQVVKEDFPYSIKSSLNHQVVKEDLPYSIKSSLNHQVVKEDLPYSIKSSLNHQVVKENLPYSIKSSLNHQVEKEDLPYSIKSSLNHQVEKEELPYSIKSSLNHQVVKEDLPYSSKSSLRLAAVAGLTEPVNSMTSAGYPNRLSSLSHTNCRSTSTNAAFLTQRFLLHYFSLERNSTKEDSSNIDRLSETKTPTISNNNRQFRQSLLSRFVLPPRKRTMNPADLPSANDLANSDIIPQFPLPMSSRQPTAAFKEIPSKKQQEQNYIAVSLESQDSSMKCNVGLTFKLNQLLKRCGKDKSGKSRVQNGSCNSLKADKTEGLRLDGIGDCMSSTNLEDLRCLRDHSKEELLGATDCRDLSMKEQPSQDIFGRQSIPSRTKYVKHHKSAQILNTPFPVRHFDCFKNGRNGEDVEEPIVCVPNYFMDLETEPNPNRKMLSQDNNPTTSKVMNGERAIEDKEIKRWNEIDGMDTMETRKTAIPKKRDVCFQVANNQSDLCPPNTDNEKTRTQCEYFSIGSSTDTSIDSTLKNYATDMSEKKKQKKYDKPSSAQNKRNVCDSLHVMAHKESSELFGDSDSDNDSDRNSAFIQVAFSDILLLSPVKPDLGFNCETSTKSTESHSTSEQTKKIGNKIHKCKEYDKKFGTYTNLTRNSTVLHAVEKPYVCEHCSKRFNRSSNLKAHLRTHSHVKPYNCEFCDKAFHQKIDMKIHRYTHTGEKPHKCSICGRGFRQLTHLTYHMRTHSDVKIFKCEFCGKGFNQKGNLQAHIHGHTGERPHKCEVCNKGFTLTSTLNTHRRTHAVTKPFECDICHKAFYQKNALKTHYISSHPLVNGVCLL